MNKFAHVYPAMVTPMHEDGSFNLEAAKKHADWMISEMCIRDRLPSCPLIL